MKLYKSLPIIILLLTFNLTINAQESFNELNWVETIEYINKNKSEFKGSVFTSPKEFIFQLDEQNLTIIYLLENSHTKVNCSIITLDQANNEGAQVFLDFTTKKCTRYEFDIAYKKGVNQKHSNKLETDFIDFIVAKDENTRSRKIIDAFKHLAYLNTQR